MDQQKYVDELIASKYEEAEAKQIVEKLFLGIDKLMVNESDDAKELVASMKIREYISLQNTEKHEVLVLGVDDMKDANGYNKYLAREAYKANKTRALKEGIVRLATPEDLANIPKLVEDIAGDKVVILDSKKFLDDKKTMKNRKFGKPIETFERREAIVFFDGKIVRAFGKFDVKVGYVYYMFGAVNEKGFFNVNETPAPRMLEAVDDSKLWEAAYSALTSADNAFRLASVTEMDKGKTVLTKGYIKYVGSAGEDGKMIVISDDGVDDGVVGFSACVDVASDMENLSIGMEAIIVGRTIKVKDRENPAIRHTGITVLGVIANPMAMQYSDVLGKLNEVIF